MDDATANRRQEGRAAVDGGRVGQVKPGGAFVSVWMRGCVDGWMLCIHSDGRNVVYYLYWMDHGWGLGWTAHGRTVCMYLAGSLDGYFGTGAAWRGVAENECICRYMCIYSALDRWVR